MTSLNPLTSQLNLCHEGVDRDGEYQPCDEMAVAVRLDEELPYPVCAAHVRSPMLPLSALVDSSRRISVCRTCRETNGHTMSCPRGAFNDVPVLPGQLELFDGPDNAA